MKSILVLTVLTLMSVSTRAQSLGIELGVGQHLQSGSFRAPCGCTFTQGVGNGFSGGLLYDLFSFGGLAIGARGGIDFKQIRSSHYWPPVTPTLTDNATLSTTYFNLAPYVRFTIPGTGAFVQAAAGESFLTASHFYQHRVKIDGTTWMNGSSDSTLEDGPFGEINSKLFSATASVGYIFPLAQFSLAPMISYNIPISDIKTYQSAFNASAWRIESWYGSVLVQMNLF